NGTVVHGKKGPKSKSSIGRPSLWDDFAATEQQNNNDNSDSDQAAEEEKAMDQVGEDEMDIIFKDLEQLAKKNGATSTNNAEMVVGRRSFAPPNSLNDQSSKLTTITTTSIVSTGPINKSAMDQKTNKRTPSSSSTVD